MSAKNKAALPVKIAECISTYSLLPPNGEVCVALSGGADSVALMLALAELNYSVSAIHINHCIRGEESDRDQHFCEELCASKGIELHAFRVDVPSALGDGASVEEKARELRYAALFSNYSGVIATAHTLSDSLETVLNNLTRGTGLKGLCGIPAKRDRIIRPMLFATRQDVEDYLESLNQPFVTDSTNLTLDYTRNKLRHRVVPVLKELNEGLYSSALSGRKALECDNTFIEAEADKVWAEAICGDALVNIGKAHRALRIRCISRLLSERALPTSFARLTALDEILMNGGSIQLSDNAIAIGGSGSIEIRQLHKPMGEWKTPLFVGENCLPIGARCIVEQVDLLKNGKLLDYHDIINDNFTSECLDCAKIKGTAVAGSRREGERIQLCGRSFSSRVKTLLNASSDRESREKLCFIYDDEGIIYIEGVGIADRVKLDESSSQLFRIRILRD